MAENKEYISREDELGCVSISEEVLSAIAGAAAVEVEGVSGLGGGLGNDLAVVVGRKLLSRGVRLSVEEEHIVADVSVTVKYGYVVPDVAKAVQEAVCSALENTSSLHVRSVNVTVAGVTFQK